MGSLILMSFELIFLCFIFVNLMALVANSVFLCSKIPSPSENNVRCCKLTKGIAASTIFEKKRKRNSLEMK